MRIPLRECSFAFIDIETTGLKPHHEILEIGGLLVSPKFTVEEEFAYKTQPLRIEEAEPDALIINGYSEERWRDAQPLRDVLSAMWSKWEGRIFAGWNITFDYARMEKSFYDAGLPNPFFRRKIDVLSIAYGKLFSETSLEVLSLQEVAAYFHVDIGNHHHALDDARATYAVFLKLMGDALQTPPSTLFTP